MKKQEFIDALIDAGWQSTNDAQWTEIEKLWRKLFPTVAALNDEMIEAVKDAHMAGQYNKGDGVDPSYSEAQSYCKDIYNG